MENAGCSDRSKDGGTLSSFIGDVNRQLSVPGFSDSVVALDLTSKIAGWILGVEEALGDVNWKVVL